GLTLEIGLTGKMSVADLAAVRRRYDAVADLERIGGDPEALGRKLEQHGAHLGAGEAQRRAAVLDRLAARGLPFVWRAAGISRNHGHMRERHVELLGGDLGERRDDALAELDLAGEDSDPAVGADAQPGIEHPVGFEAARQPRLILGGRERGAEAE